MIYHNKKYKAWEVLKTYHENKFKYNSDFTYKINDRFTIEVNLLTSNDDSVILRANLIQDDGFVLYNVDMIPADDIWQVVNGFEYIVSIMLRIKAMSLSSTGISTFASCFST